MEFPKTVDCGVLEPDPNLYLMPLCFRFPQPSSVVDLTREHLEPKQHMAWAVVRHRSLTHNQSGFEFMCCFFPAFSSCLLVCIEKMAMCSCWERCRRIPPQRYKTALVVSLKCPSFTSLSKHTHMYTHTYTNIKRPAEVPVDTHIVAAAQSPHIHKRYAMLVSHL